jgi:MurNAc alpha-1-phosphate uridylyltransferase
MKAMIMAAGKGTRLGAITENMPKALVEINGKSMLRLAVEKCSRYGFSDIIVNVHHFAEMVETEVERLNSSGFNVSVSDEREMLLENGGGLFKARDFFDDNPFLVCNVDIITDLDLSQLYNYHIQNKGLATLAVRNRTDSRYLLVNSKGILKGWCNNASGEKIICDKKENILNEIAFSSFQIMDPVCFKNMTEGVYTLVELYLNLAGRHKINTFRHDEGYWFNVGTPEILESVRLFFADKSGK